MSKNKFTCFREKPKHRVRTIIIASLIVVALVAATIFGIGFFKPTDFDELEDKGYETVKMQVPVDSSTPEDHTALEIVGYMNYTLSNQSNWYSEMHGSVNTIISQEIATYKQFSNGILISADITTSSMIANANQFCTTDEAVLWRSAAGGKETYNGKDTAWVSDAPQGLKISEYKSKRGLPPSTFSVYIINENTLLTDGTSERAVKNDDGTYSITLNLNTASDGETSAVYYYKQQMAVTGGLSSHPTFNSINVKYTFDSNYRVLKTEINETYQATMGVSVTCNAISTTEFNYESGWENTAYEDYFKNYVDNFSSPDEETGVQITAVGCLSSAFGSVLVDGGTFSIDLGLNGETESGIVDVALSGGGLSSLAAQIGNIDVRFVNDGKNNIYVAYGSGAKFSLCIDDIDLSPLGSMMGGVSIDTAALMEQLGNGTFTVSEDKTKATLECELSLLGLNIPLNFSFNILENGDATLNFVKTTLDLGGESISASLAFADRNLAPKPLTESEKATYAAFDTAKINSLINSIASEVVKLDFDLSIGGIGIEGNISIDIAKLALSADLSITSDGTTKDISIAYKDGMVYLTLGENSKIKTSLSQAIELISSFLSGSSTPSTDIVPAKAGKTTRNSTSNASLTKTSIANGLKNMIVAVDEQVSSGSSFSLMNLVYTLLFDQSFTENLSVAESGEIKINVDGVLKGVGVDLSEMLGTNIELGEFTANINDDGKLNLTSPSLNITVSEGEQFEIVEEDFVNVDLLALSDQIFAIINEGRLSLSGEITISIGEANIPITINRLSLEFADGLSIYLNASISLNGVSHRLIVSYSESGATVVYDDFGVTLTADEYVALGDVVKELVSIVDGIDVDIDLSSVEKIINTIVSQVGSSDLSVASILNILESLNISTDSDGNFILNIDGLGIISLSTTDGLKFGIDMQVNGVSIDANAQFIDFEEGALPTDLEYLDGSVAIGVLEQVANILTNKSVGLSGSVAVTIDGTIIPVEISALNIDFSNGIAVELSATIMLGEVEHSLYLSYNESGAKLVFDELGVNLTTDELNELIAKIGELAGVSLDMSSVGGLNVELNSIFDIINNLKLASSESGLTVGYGEYEIVLGLGGEITASTEITIENIGISASLTLGDKVAITAPETECVSGATLINVLDKVSAILNNKSVGLSGSIEISLDGTIIPVEISALNVDFSNGIAVELSATITLGDKTHSLYLSYNESGAKLVFDELGVNLTTDELNELIAKIGELAGISLDMSSVGGLNVELNSIFDIINNLKLISSENGLTVGYGEYEIVLGLGGEITASTEITIENIGISASLTLGEVTAITAPETECVSGATLINVLDKVSAILNNKSVGLSGAIEISIDGTTIPVEISALNIDFNNGIAVELSATIDLNGTVHNLYLSYGESGAKLVFDELGVNLTTEELNELIAKIGELAGVSLDMSSVGGLNVELNSIFDIINNLKLISSENGLTVGYGEYEIVLGLGGEITASTEIAIENIGISASLTLGEVTAITAPTTECVSGATLINVLDKVSAILNNKSVGLSGAIEISIDGTTIPIEISALNVDFSNGIAVELSATIDLNGTVHNLYLSYGESGAKLVFDELGVNLTTDELNELIAKIGELAGVSLDMSSVGGLNVELNSIFDIINNLKLVSSENGLTVGYGEYEIVLGLGDKITASTEITIENIGISASLTLGEVTAITAPTTECVSGATLINVLNKVSAILNNKSVGLSGSIAVTMDGTTIPVEISALNIDFNNGIAVELSATITLGDKTHSLYLSYNESGAKLVFDELGVNLTTAELNDLIAKIGELAGVSLDMSSVGGLNVELNSIFDIINNLKLISSDNGLTVGYGEYEIVLGLGDIITASTEITIENIGISASLTLGEVTTITAPTTECVSGATLINVLDKVSAILNTKSVGLSGSIAVTIDGITIPVEISALNVDFSNGIAVELSATIDLNGTVHNLYLSYNESGAKLVFDELGVNLTTDELNELIAKIGELAGVSLDMSSVGGLNVELNSIFDIINNLKLVSSESGLTVGYGEYEIVLGLGGEITASTEITIENIGIAASLTLGEVTAITAPETECVSGATLIIVLNKVSAILNNKSVGLSGSIAVTVDGTIIPVEISALNVDFSNGIAVELSATITLGEVEHSLYLSYNESGAKLVFDELGVNLTNAELNELIAKIGELAGVSLDMSGVGGLNVELNSIFDIINNLKLISSESGLTVGYGEYEIVLGLGGEITASTEITIENIGITASLTLGEVTTITAPTTECVSGATLINVLDKVSAILNNKSVGLSGSIAVTVDGTIIPVEISALNVDFNSGIAVELSAKITLGEVEHSLYLSYNASGAKLVFDELGVNLTTAELNDLIAKIGELAGVSLDMSSVGGLNVELNSIFDIINNLKLVSSESGLTVGYGEYEIVLGLGGEITASTEITIENIGISASLTLGEVTTITAPETECVSGATLINVLDKVSAILNNKSVGLSGSIAVTIDGTTIPVEISALNVDFNNGIAVELSAKITLGDKIHSLYLSYNESGAKLVFDELGVNLTTTELNELIAKIGELAGVSLDMSGVGGLNVELNSIFDIINNLKLISSENGLTVGYGEYEIVLGLGGEITASTEITIENIGITASLTLGDKVAITAPETECVSGATLNALLDEISAILTDGRFRIAVTGENALRIIAGDTVVTLSDIIFELNFKNGIGFELNASIDIGNNKHDFYAFYADDMLKFSYGTFGAELKIGGADNDLDKLKSAVVELYNRVAKIIDTMTGAGTPTAQATSFDDLVALLKGLDSGNVLAGVIEQITSLVSIDTQTNTLDTIINLINSLQLSSNANGLTVKMDSLIVSFEYLVSENANFNVGIVYETNEFKIVAENIELGKVTENNGAYERVESYLTVDGFIEMLDYLGATVDMFAEDNFTLRLQGTVYSSELKYTQYNSVRYNISAMLEFGWGENGYPAHLEVPDKDGNGTWNFWLDPTMYAHIGVNVAANHEDDESYKIDVYLLDSNPSTSSGITQNGASTDGELDIYISISVLSKGVASNPLMIYMPASDLMTIVAAGAAMLDLGSLGLNTDGLDGLNLTIANIANSVIGSLAGAVDTLIIDKYLSDTREQFESLGASLITQILGSSLNDMISNLFSSIGGDTQEKQEVVLNSVLPSNVTAGGFIKELSFNENRDALVVLNGEYIYGSADFDDIIFTATKHTVEKEDGTTHTLLRSAEIKNIYYNSNNKFSVDLELSMSYEDIERKTSFANYYNFAEIDSLLTTLVNSATHEVVKEDGTKGYDLNKNFYLDGSINLSVLGLYNASVAINGLSVSIDENNAVSANVRLSYDKVELFFGAVSVINNKAVVDISIKDDMIYIKRAVSGGATTYRAMTLSDFSGDIMNQIIYILSLGKTVTSNMNSSSSGSSSSTALDLGATIKQYLKSFTSSTSDNGKSWTLTINGSGIESLASGLSISDIPVTISAAKSGNGYVATSLAASGKMFSVISFDLGLTYRNPQTTSDSYSGDVTNSIYSETLTTINGEPVSFEKILGGTSFADISKTVEWKLLLADQGTKYFEYTGGDIKIGTLNYKYQTPAGQEMSFDGTYLALYNTKTNKLYTIANYPDLSVMEEVEGQTKVWAAPEISASGVVLRAVYANTYSVTVNSGYQTDYTPVEPELDGTYTTVYENVYLNKLLPINLTVEDKDHNVYLLTGYTYADGTAVDCSNTAYDNFGNLCIVLNVDGDKVVNAVWELARKVTLEEYSKTTVLYFVDGTQLTAEMLPATAERVGYFGSWMFDGVTLSEDIVITAEYVVSTHTVSVTSDFAIEGYSLNSETGKYEWSQTFEYGTEYVFADIQSIDLYTFGGYYLTAGGKIENEQYITSDMSLYIRWIAKSINVNVNSPLAYSYDSREYLSGDTTITLSDGIYNLSAPAAEGYTFLGWGIKNDSWSIFGETNLTSYVASNVSSIELYPIWAKADSSNISMSRSGFGAYSFSVKGVINWTVEANAELLSNISCEATYSFRSYYDFWGRNKNWINNEALTLNSSLSGTVLTVSNTAINYKSGNTALLIDSDMTSSFKVKCGDTYSNAITTSNHADFAAL